MLGRQKLIVALIICFVFIFTEKGFTGFLEEKTEGKHSFDVKAQMQYFSYNASDWRKIWGWLFGAGLSYQFRFTKKIVLKPEINAYGGTLRYNGPLELTDNSSRGTIKGDGFLLDILALAGYDAKITDKSSVMPYTGLGYRYFEMDTGEHITYNTGTRTIKITRLWYDTIYSPLGIKFNQQLDDGWSSGQIFEAIIPYDSPPGYGLRGAVEVKKRSDVFNIGIEPFVRYWKFKRHTRSVYDGDVEVGRIEEPSKEIKEIGIAIKIGF